MVVICHTLPRKDKILVCKINLFLLCSFPLDVFRINIYRKKEEKKSDVKDDIDLVTVCVEGQHSRGCTLKKVDFKNVGF